jgi:hypothetical protein
MKIPISIRSTFCEYGDDDLYSHSVEVFEEGTEPGKSLNVANVWFRRKFDKPFGREVPIVSYASAGSCTAEGAERRARAILEAVRIAKMGWENIMYIQTFAEWKKENE